MSYVIYARKSQEAEERQAQSIEDQLRLTRKCAQERGKIVSEEIYESRSAKEPFRREGFQRMLEAIDQGKIEGIIAWHPDRLSRNEIDAAALTFRLRHGKLKDLQFVNYTFNNSPEGLMMLQMALSQSQYYSSKLAIDVTRGMESKRTKGWFPHYVPQGYLNDPITRTNLPDPERFASVRRFWELMLSQKYTVPEALDILNTQWGFRTRPSYKRGGKPLSRAGAYLLLNNVFYTGHFVIKGTTYKGSHEPMVTAEEFQRVQAQLQRRTKHRRRQHEFAYTGLLRCKHCGCQITATIAKGKYKEGEWTYYHCTNKRGNCDQRGIEEKKLEEKINALLKSLTIHEKVADYTLNAVANWHKEQSGVTETVYEEQMQALAQAQKQLTNLLDLKLREMIDDSLFSQKQQELKKQILTLRQATENTETEFERIRTSALNTYQFLSRAHDQFLLGTLHEKREIARALGIAYTFDRGEIEIDVHPALLVHLRFKHPEMPSESNKKDGFDPPVLSGGTEKTLLKHLYAFLKDKPLFPALSCLQNA